MRLDPADQGYPYSSDVARAFLILTHLALLPSMRLAWSIRNSAPWLLFGLVSCFIASSMYHSCYSFDACFFANAKIHKHADHYISTMLAPDIFTTFLWYRRRHPDDSTGDPPPSREPQWPTSPPPVVPPSPNQDPERGSRTESAVADSESTWTYCARHVFCCCRPCGFCEKGGRRKGRGPARKYALLEFFLGERAPRLEGGIGIEAIRQEWKVTGAGRDASIEASSVSDADDSERFNATHREKRRRRRRRGGRKRHPPGAGRIGRTPEPSQYGLLQVPLQLQQQPAQSAHGEDPSVLARRLVYYRPLYINVLMAALHILNIYFHLHLGWNRYADMMILSIAAGISFTSHLTEILATGLRVRMVVVALVLVPTILAYLVFWMDDYFGAIGHNIWHVLIFTAIFVYIRFGPLFTADDGVHVSLAS